MSVTEDRTITIRAEDGGYVADIASLPTCDPDSKQTADLRVFTTDTGYRRLTLGTSDGSDPMEFADETIEPLIVAIRTAKGVLRQIPT